MSVLILNRGPLALRPYHEMLADYPGELVLLASAEELAASGETLPADLPGYAHAEVVTDYDTTGKVEARVLELARKHKVEYLIASQENDLERAAALREILGLPGQGVDSAMAFRNKVLMKELASAAGIRVAKYAEIETPVDALAFARQHGVPLVFKPRNGSSSVGLTMVHSAEELDEFLATSPDLRGDSQPNLMVEAFVHGSMCHVDGMVMGGRVVAAWPSQYQYRLASFEDQAPRLDLTLDPADPLAQRLLALTDQVLLALPTPQHCTFHMEVFHSVDDELVLCEIASRNGGALIKSVLQAMYGLNFPLEWIRTQVGLPLPVELPAGGRLRPAKMAGQLLLLKRPGLVRSVPEKPPFEWIESYVPYIRTGQRMERAKSSGDFMVGMVASGADRCEVAARLRQASAWFDENLDIEAVR